MQLTLVLLVYSTSGAGYYTHPGFEDIMTVGYIRDQFAEFSNSLAIIGTVASAAAVAALFFIRPGRWPWILSAFLAFQAYWVVSATWSPVLLETFYAVFKICVYALALWVVLGHLTFRQITAALAVAALLIGLVSAYLALTNPVFTFSLGAEGWRGLFMTKNQMGAFCMFAIVLLFPACFMTKGGARLSAMAVTAALVVLLGLSQSKTGIALTGLYMSSGYLAYRLSTDLDKSRALLFVTLGWIIAVAAFAPTLLDAVAGGEVTFTGRVRIWQFFIDQLDTNVIFGMGGFATPLDRELASKAIVAVQNAGPDSSWVSILCNAGLVGILLYLFLLGACFKFHYENQSSYSVFAYCGVLVYLTFGAVESSAQLTGGFPTLVLLAQVFIATLAARSRAGDRSPSAPARPGAERSTNGARLGVRGATRVRSG